jgi:2',3'-cyclic-nucleotide 2'-phosphodiesterase (5'-nucleotidase family)
MKRSKAYLYLVLFLLFACTASKKNLEIAASFNEINNIQDDSTIYRIIQPYKTSLDKEMNIVIGSLAKPLIKGDPLLGYFVADCVLEYAKTIYKETDFCVLNNGGLRASLPEGDLTVRNIFELMPFDNEIVVVSLTGSQCKKIFQYIADKKVAPISGMTIETGPNFSKDGFVYKNPKIGKENVDENRSYYIATSDYLAGGGDNMTFFAEGTIRTTSIKIRDAIINHIRLQTDQNIKISQEEDGRIGAIY